MKMTQRILKLTAFVLSLASIVCLILAELDRITACLEGLAAKLPCKGCCGQEEETWDDEFEDWDV